LEKPGRKRHIFLPGGIFLRAPFETKAGVFMTHRPLGAVPQDDGIRFTVFSAHAQKIDLCLFDGERETTRLPLLPDGEGLFSLHVPGIEAGTCYGFRADGVYDPDRGLWFDPSKLLTDPYATELDRPYLHDPRLSQFGVDTAQLAPKAVVRQHAPVQREKQRFQAGGLIYEVAVRPFTMLHPDVPETLRGTVAALAHPTVIAHLKRIGVDAVELMPITAWIDERHLPALGLTSPMAGVIIPSPSWRSIRALCRAVWPSLRQPSKPCTTTASA
jgi:glycogen debranching enzyme